jgi:hypothetical protein
MDYKLLLVFSSFLLVFSIVLEIHFDVVEHMYIIKTTKQLKKSSKKYPKPMVCNEWYVWYHPFPMYSTVHPFHENPKQKPNSWNSNCDVNHFQAYPHNPIW